MPVTPSAIGANGSLTYLQWGEVADDGSNIAFAYGQGSPVLTPYLWINGSSYEIDDETYPITTHRHKVLIIPGQSYVYLVWGGTGASNKDYVKAAWFNFSGEAVGSKTWEVSDCALLDAIVLSDNRILIAWYEDIDSGTDLPVYYSYGDYNGWTDVGPETISGGSVQQNRGTITQLDSSTIWMFLAHDSVKTISAIKMGISEGVISVTGTYEPLIDSGDGDLYPQGELPYLKAITVSNYMLLAYQNDTDYTFAVGPPLIKGAYIAIAKIEADASFSEEAIIEEYFERVGRFSFSYRADWGWCLVGAIINSSQTLFNQLYLFAEGGRKRCFGQIAGGTGTTSLQILDYSDWVVTKMADTYLRFYSLEKPTGPFPTHFVL